MAIDVNPGRRRFLGTSIGAGAAPVLATHSREAEAGVAKKAGADYPVVPILKFDELKKRASVNFSYPDESSPCTLVRLNSAVDGGIGPDGNIVAFSSMCTHMGCIVSFDDSTQTFQCPCHFSVFDPENNGQMVCGQATENLPRIELSHDRKTGQIVATGVHGRLYGRVSNIL